eukprot:scaffold56442_cov38-Prasinocladus_malaysianus.AAC.1
MHVCLAGLGCAGRGYAAVPGRPISARCPGALGGRGLQPDHRRGHGGGTSGQRLVGARGQPEVGCGAGGGHRGHADAAAAPGVGNDMCGAGGGAGDMPQGPCQPCGQERLYALLQYRREMMPVYSFRTSRSKALLSFVFDCSRKKSPVVITNTSLDRKR